MSISVFPVSSRSLGSDVFVVLQLFMLVIIDYPAASVSSCSSNFHSHKHKLPVVIRNLRNWKFKWMVAQLIKRADASIPFLPLAHTSRLGKCYLWIIAWSDFYSPMEFACLICHRVQSHRIASIYEIVEQFFLFFFVISSKATRLNVNKSIIPFMYILHHRPPKRNDANGENKFNFQLRQKQ